MLPLEQEELSALRALTSFPFLAREVGIEPGDFVFQQHRQFAEALAATAYFLPDGSASPLEVGKRAGWDRSQVAQDFEVQYQILAQARDAVRQVRTASLGRAFVSEVEREIQGGKPGPEAIRRVAELARGYSARLESGASSVTNLETVTLAYIEDRQRQLQRGGRSAVLSTGLSRLDYAIRGWRSGELTTLVASGGAGKSTLGQFFRRHLAEQAIYTLKFSGEMTEEQEGERVAHAECATPMNEQLQNLIALSMAEQRLRGSGVLRYMGLDARGSLPPAYMRSIVDAQKAERGQIGMVEIDHLRHIRVTGVDRSEYATVSAAVQEAKELAKTCGVPVLLLTHTNAKANEAAVAASRGNGGDPDPGMIRGSGRIFEDSDNVLCLWRPEHLTTLYVWKARQTGMKNVKIPLEYDNRTQQFSELL
jgi:replicative DNA helicase